MLKREVVVLAILYFIADRGKRVDHILPIWLMSVSQIGIIILANALMVTATKLPIYYWQMSFHS